MDKIILKYINRAISNKMYDSTDLKQFKEELNAYILELVGEDSKKNSMGYRIAKQEIRDRVNNG